MGRIHLTQRNTRNRGRILHHLLLLLVLLMLLLAMGIAVVRVVVVRSVLGGC